MKNRFMKLLSLGLVFTMTMSMAACGKKEDTTKKTSQEEITTSTSSDAKGGTYKASAKGFGGEFEVSVAFDGEKITDIKVGENSETPGVGTVAIEQLPGKIMDAQSVGVDAVSGCTVTSNAILEATKSALEQAGADMNKFTAVAKVEQAEDETLNADVVIVGAGGAGLAAAVTAHQNGASVIVVEKMAKVGGNTILAGGAMNAVDDGSEEAIAHDDSVELHYEQTIKGGDNTGDAELVRILVENAHDSVEWLQSLGMEFKEELFTVTGGLWPRAHKPVDPVGTGFFNTYMKYIDNNENIEVRLNTKADSLIVEDGVVKGVVATGETGNKVTLNSSKGVILATGGFSKNVELREKYNTQWATLGETIKSTNHSGATGDAIGLVEPLNAELVQMGNIQLLPLGDPETGSLSGNIETDVEKRIFVNKEGNRFVDEGARRDVMTAALFEQTDNYMWIVLDSHSYPTGNEKNNFNESPLELVEQGRAVTADTLEELAKKMNVPEENLIKAVEDFNAHVEKKEADAFGRTLYSEPINQGPYYAAPRVPTVHHTMGGIKINKDTEVINQDGDVIKGLYAAGEVVGGIHGTNRLGGNALTDIAVFGRIAGETAANSK